MDGTVRVGELIAATRTRTSEIVAALDRVDEAVLTAPSVLPGWDRLTIACHLRYGAEAFARMTAATLEGKPASYYPEGRHRQRDATLRPSLGESPHDVVASLADESDGLHGLWSAMAPERWTGEVTEPADNVDLGPLPLSRLPLLRLTEVEVHGGDLDLGLGDWSVTFVDVALPFRLEWLNTRRTNHREFDRSLEGSWLLAAADGPCYRVEVAGGRVVSRPAPREAGATAVIEASSRDVLALLLGRPFQEAPRYSGDTAFAQAFRRAFPGP